MKIKEIDILDKSSTTMNFLIKKLLELHNRGHIFGSEWSLISIIATLSNRKTVIYGIYENDIEMPMGIVMFTNITVYGDSLFSIIFFDIDNKDKILIDGEYIPLFAPVKEDMISKFQTHSISTYVVGENPFYSKILESLGFEKIGVKKEAMFDEGKHKDISLYYYLMKDSDNPELNRKFH